MENYKRSQFLTQEEESDDKEDHGSDIDNLARSETRLAQCLVCIDENNVYCQESRETAQNQNLG